MRGFVKYIAVLGFLSAIVAIAFGDRIRGLTISEGLVAASILILGFFILSELYFRFRKTRMEAGSVDLAAEEQQLLPGHRARNLLSSMISRGVSLLKGAPRALRQKGSYLGRLLALLGFSLKLQLRHNWRTLISLWMILSLAVGTVTALFVWVDLAPKDALGKGLDSRQFHLIVKRGADALLYTPGALWETQDYLQGEPLAATSELVWNTLGLINIGNKSEFYDMSYFFGLEEPPPDAIFVTDQAKGQDAFLVNASYLETMHSWFRVLEGTFSFANGGILLSRQVHAALEGFLNRPIRVGAQIDVALARRALSPPDLTGWPPQLINFNRLTLGNRTVNAIFDRRPSQALKTPAFLEETLGDGLLIDSQTVPESFLHDLEADSAQRICEPKLFIRLSREELFQQGPYALEDQLRAFEVRLHSQFANPATLVIFDRTGDLRDAVEAFKQIRWMVLFAFAPLVLLPQLLLAGLMLDYDRRWKTLARKYQLRGAARGQLGTIRAAEALIVGPLAAFSGVVLGMGLVAFIPETVRFAAFKMVPLDALLADLAWSRSSWLTVALLGELPYGLLLCWQAVAKPSPLDQGSHTASRRFAGLKKLTPGPLAIFTGLFLATLLLATDVRAYVLSHQELFASYLIVLIILWIGFGTASIHLLKQLLPSLWRTLGGLRGPQLFMLMTFFRGRYGRTASLGVLLTMAFSLIVSGAAYDSTLTTGAQEEAAYLIGSDFKVFTEELNKTGLAKMMALLSQMEGIATVVPFVFVEGDLGSFHLNVIGTNVEAYLAAGAWQDVSLPAEANDHRKTQAILEALDQDPTGILISDRLAADANLELGAQLVLANLARDWRVSQNFTVRGIASSAPGFGYLATYEGPARGFGQRLGSVIVNFEMLHALFESLTVHLFLVQADPQLQEDGVQLLARELQALPQVRTIYFLPDVNLRDQAWYPVGSITGVFSLNLLVVGLLGLVSLPFVLIETLQLRRRELAVFRIFGASWAQTRTALFRENAIVTGFCLAQGMLIGALYGWILVNATLHIWSATRVLPYEFVVPLVLVGFWALVLTVGLLLSALWAVARLKAPALGLEVRNP